MTSHGSEFEQALADVRRDNREALDVLGAECDRPILRGESIEERLYRIEARQREYDMHDPDCPARVRERNQLATGMYIPVVVSCTCWLSS